MYWYIDFFISLLLFKLKNLFIKERVETLFPVNKAQKTENYEPPDSDIIEATGKTGPQENTPRPGFDPEKAQLFPIWAVFILPLPKWCTELTAPGLRTPQFCT